MKHIKVTEINRANNLNLFNGYSVGNIYKQGLPKSYNGVKTLEGGYKDATDQHEEDGWFPYVVPTITETEKLGEEYFDEDDNIFTHFVNPKSQQEIESEILRQSENQKQSLIQQKTEAKIIEDAQQGDDTNALDNQALFPMWETDFEYALDFKCQDFNSESELVLYRVVQAHKSQSNWRPKDVPALFTRVAYPDEILEWVRPTGSQDAYSIGDKVMFSGEVWISQINGNATVPDGDIPHNRYWKPFNN